MNTSSQYINIIRISQKLMCTIQFQTILVYLNPLMTYSKAKLNSNGDRASPCFKPFLIGNLSDNFLPTRTLLYVSVKHIFINFRLGISNDVLLSYFQTKFYEYFSFLPWVLNASPSASPLTWPSPSHLLLVLSKRDQFSHRNTKGRSETLCTKIINALFH